MSHDIEALIQSRWQDDYCPCVDGVLFHDGSLVLMECSLITGGPTAEVQVRPLARATLASFLEYNPDSWSSIGRGCAFTWPERGLQLFAGEGGLGSDGFVACTSLDNQRLLWLAFFQCSNPFREVRGAGEEVVAVSTYGHLWFFPLANPERVRVTR